MQNNVIGSELLKVDRLGRVLVSAQRREALLDAFESCGVSGVEFAAHIGVKYQTFATWRQKRNHQRQVRGVANAVAVAPQPPAGVQWLEAVLENPGTAAISRMSDHATGGCVLNILLPGGARMEIADVAQMAR